MGNQSRPWQDYLLMIRQRWFLGLLMAGIAAGSYGYVHLQKPEIFSAQATLLVERSPERIINIQEVIEQGLDEAILQTHQTQMSSRAFLSRVSETFNERERDRITSPYIDPEDENQTPPSVHGIIASNLRISRPRGSIIFTISMRHRNADAAAMVANRFVEEYLRYLHDRSGTSNISAINFLREQAEVLRSQVEESEKELQNWRQRHQLVSVEENQNIVVQRLNTLSGSVTAARGERLNLENTLRQTEKYLEEGLDPFEIHTIASFGPLVQLKQERDVLISNRRQLEERYLHRHPRMVENQLALDGVERRIDENIKLALADLRSRYNDALTQEEKMREELRNAESEALQLGQLAVDFNVLRQEAATKRNTLDQVLRRLNDTNVASQLETLNVKIADTAAPSSNPVEPDRRRIIMMMCFLGFVAFVGIPIGLGTIDSRIKNMWDVEIFLGRDMLAEIPSVNRLPEKERPLIVQKEEEDVPLEAFRGLYSQIQVTSHAEGSRVILVTSTIPGEGKSFIASNLATAFGKHGERTLLVDADFRRPSLHRNFDLKNEGGIVPWYQKNQDDPGADVSLYEPEVGLVCISRNLDLLRAGGRSKTPTEMISSPRFENLIKAARREYDLVILDCPPTALFPDAFFLAEHGDELIFVTRYGTANRRTAKLYLEKLDQTPSRVLGVIINATPPSSITSYYGYGYSYYHNYRRYKKYYERPV